MPSREHAGTPGERPVFQLHGTYIMAQLRSGFMVVNNSARTSGYYTNVT